LDAITASGIGLDLGRREGLVREAGALLAEKAAALAARGYKPGKGSAKALQELIRRALQRHPGQRVPRTATGKYATSDEALAALAQAVLRQFGGRSAMAEAINRGEDLHRLVAARVTGKAESEVSAGERARAKPINFGKPGGMGRARLRDYARAGYGIRLGDAE